MFTNISVPDVVAHICGSTGACVRSSFSFVFAVVVFGVVFRDWSLVWAQKDFFALGLCG